MKPRIRPFIVSQCSACIRNYAEVGLSPWRPLLQHQTRGAKSSKRPDTVPVQLLKDLEKFGRKGAFVPVPAGTMRNKWFPYSIARYPTFEERRAIKRGEIDVIRDYDYEIMVETKGGHLSRSANGSLDAAWQKYLGNDTTMAAADIEIKPIEPSRAISLLDVLLPDALDFERKPVLKPQSQMDSKSKLPASVQAMLKASLPEAPTPIYGSVSTQDVAQFIRDTVAYNDEAAQIQINENNLKFVNPVDGDDATRIKHLGQYEVEISFKGAETTIRKRVSVKKPQEGSTDVLIDPSMDSAASSAEVIGHR